MSSSLMNQVYTFLRASIINGDWRANEYLSTMELAEELGVSRTPVRDAVNQLSGEGILDLRGKAGAMLHQMSISEYEDFLGVRQALEPFAAAEAAKHIPYDAVAALGKDCRQMSMLTRQIIDSGFSDDALCWQLQRLDESFHRTIHEYSQNRKLCNIIEDFQLLTIKFSYPSSRCQPAMVKTLYEHWRVYRALKAGNTRKAHFWMERHLSRHAVDARNAYRAFLESSEQQSIPKKAKLNVTGFKEKNDKQ